MFYLHIVEGDILHKAFWTAVDKDSVAVLGIVQGGVVAADGDVLDQDIVEAGSGARHSFGRGSSGSRTLRQLVVPGCNLDGIHHVVEGAVAEHEVIDIAAAVDIRFQAEAAVGTVEVYSFVNDVVHVAGVAAQ